MRNLIVFSVVLFLSQFLPQTVSAQIITTWKGGIPGQESKWDCSKNWSRGRIPDIFDNVIIPNVSTGSQKYPIIKTGMIEINQLYIHSNATLTLQESVRILVNEFNNYGTCIACDRAVKIKGLDFFTFSENH
jgi:hypothetical protein